MVDGRSGPLIQYEMVFPGQRLLLGTGMAGQGGSETTEAVNNGYMGVAESLSGIEWEPHVDEADKLDYLVAAGSGVLAGLIDAFYEAYS